MTDILNKKNQTAKEINFDGLVGPTHNYAGLAFGNVASIKNARQSSHPKLAALQGLEKMHLMLQLGLTQAIIPPQERPNLPLLRNLGFSGSDMQILTAAKKNAPAIFYAAYSSSSMWTANAATVSPSIDTADGKLHISPANLHSHFHRSTEAEMTYKILQRIFKDKDKFQVHPLLPPQAFFSDEGAANHNRLCLNYGDPGFEIFVYGRSDLPGVERGNHPKTYPARQTLAASEAISRRHQLNEKATFFIKQNPEVIDKGVFHNDVISVINQNVILSHELAYEGSDEKNLYSKLNNLADFPIHLITIKEEELSITKAVETYLFNSQLITLPNGSMALIAPEECKKELAAMNVLNKILAENNPIQELHFVNCWESMKNGGGPACLRLRVVLTEAEQNALNQEILLDEKKYQALTAWVNRYYREEITDKDLLDPQLVEESQRSLDELTKIINLGPLYSFQH